MLAAAIVAVATVAAAPAAPSLLARANTFIGHGDFDAARRLAAEAPHGAAEEILGAVDEARNSLVEAAENYRRALTIAEQTGDSTLIVSATEGLSRMYGQQGRSDLFLALADRVMQVDPGHRATYLYLRGTAYSSLNDSEGARQAFDEALPLAEKQKDLSLIAEIRRQRGLRIWRFERDLPRTIAEYDQALSYARRAKAARIVVLTLINYGNVFRNRDVKRFPEALQRYDEALAIARREHLSFQIAYTLKNIGIVYRQQGDAARAESSLREALSMADQGNLQDVRWMTENELGTLARNRDPAKAEQYFRDAIAIIEGEQSDVLLADFRPGALADSVRFANPYDQLINLLLGEHQPAAAFLVAERQRARAFLETLSGAREALARQVPTEFVSAERTILDRIKTSQAALRAPDLTEARRAELTAAVGHSESELADLRMRLATDDPSLSSLARVRFPKLWSISDLQSKLLAPDETLLAFYLGADHSVAWVVRRDRFSTITLPPAKEIERAATVALQQLRTPLSQGQPAMKALSSALHIDTVAGLAGTPRLLIIPDGILNEVPFDALLDSTGHPLVERFAISYAPSASSLAFLRSQHSRIGGPVTLIAVANPIVSGKKPAAQRSVDLAHMNLLQPVPQSSGEAHQIAELFGPSSVVLEGARATLSELRIEGVQQTRILHFATHGLIDEARPDRSGLLLTADPPHDDGLLQVRDIDSMRLNADLVTLSACETALGQNVTGEGVVGLTRAFFIAGARSVVASLWDVDDASTSRFMKGFYAHIRNGEAIDLALQHAKIEFIREGGATTSPFYWASFVASGNARTVIAAPEAPNGRLKIRITILALLAAILYFWMVSVRRGEVTSGRP